MTSGLRKAHKYIWLLLIVIVPIVMMFSVKGLEVFNLNKEDNENFKSSKKQALKSAENNFIKASLHENSIELILKSPLKNSSSILYGSKGKNKPFVIGQLNGIGVYNFEVKEPIEAIHLFDELKNENITQLTFR